MSRLRVLRLARKHGLGLGDLLVTAGSALHFADANRMEFEAFVAQGRPLDGEDRTKIRALVILAHGLVTPGCDFTHGECSDAQQH